MAINVEIKTVPAMRVASITEKVTDYEVQQSMWRELSEYLRAHGVRVCGPLVGLDHSEGYIEDGIRLEVTAPVDVALPENDRVRVYDLPALEMAASTLHVGDPAGVKGTYRLLMFWLRDNGYRIIGPSREIYLEFPGSETGDPLTDVSGQQDPVIEVLIPVVKIWPEPKEPA